MFIYNNNDIILFITNVLRKTNVAEKQRKKERGKNKKYIKREGLVSTTTYRT